MSFKRTVAVPILTFKQDHPIRLNPDKTDLSAKEEDAVGSVVVTADSAHQQSSRCVEFIDVQIEATGNFARHDSSKLIAKARQLLDNHFIE